MKPLIITTFALISLLFQCDPYYYEPFSEYKPILMEREELEKSISFSTAREMIQPGKIYLKGDTIYINERYKGVHVIDNTNPGNPIKVGFIVVPGCIDMAMKTDVLYADNSVDLVSIKLGNNLSALTVTKRLKNIFPELMPPDNRTLQSQYLPENRPENTVIVGWEKIYKDN
ncbi:MAG: hypothetical protein ABFS35_05470 [Bacteroidota bacterium]